MGERGGDVRLSGSRIAHEQYVLMAVEVLAAHEFEDEVFVDAGLRGEVEGVERFYDGKLGGADAAFCGALFALQGFAFGQAQQVGDMVLVFFRADLRDGFVLA